MENVNYWESCKKLKFDHPTKWYIHNQNLAWRRTCRKFSAILRYKNITKFLSEDQTERLLKKKKTNRIVVFGVPTDHIVKIKENENKDKYLDLAEELNMMWNMTVTDTNCNWCVWNSPQGQCEAETIQTTALFRSVRILRRVLETWRDLLSLRLLSTSWALGETERRRKER